jgi:hypothetical protein
MKLAGVGSGAADPQPIYSGAEICLANPVIGWSLFPVSGLPLALYGQRLEQNDSQLHS